MPLAPQYLAPNQPSVSPSRQGSRGPDKRVVLVGTSHRYLGQALASHLGCPLVQASVGRFANQELWVHLNTPLDCEEAIVLACLGHQVNDRLVEVCLLADAARQATARRISAIIPYLGYSRQDRPWQCPSGATGPASAQVVAKILDSCDFDRLITLDLHTPHLTSFFKTPVINLDPTALVTRALTPGPGLVVVSPDKGSAGRGEALSRAWGVPFALLSKARQSDSTCTVHQVLGPSVAEKDCLLVDDVLDTGQTLRASARFLRAHKAKSVRAWASHDLFSPTNCHQVPTHSPPAQHSLVHAPLAQTMLSPHLFAQTLPSHGLDYLEIDALWTTDSLCQEGLPWERPAGFHQVSITQALAGALVSPLLSPRASDRKTAGQGHQSNQDIAT